MQKCWTTCVMDFCAHYKHLHHHFTAHISSSQPCSDHYWGRFFSFSCLVFQVCAELSLSSVVSLYHMCGFSDTLWAVLAHQVSHSTSAHYGSYTRYGGLRNKETIFRLATLREIVLELCCSGNLWMPLNCFNPVEECLKHYSIWAHTFDTWKLELLLCTKLTVSHELDLQNVEGRCTYEKESMKRHTQISLKPSKIMMNLVVQGMKHVNAIWDFI